MSLFRTFNSYRTSTSISLLKVNASTFTRISRRQFHWKWGSLNSFSSSSTNIFHLLVRAVMRRGVGTSDSVSEQLAIFFRLLSRQCNVYAAQRLRRVEQMIYLYRSLYSERSLQSLTLGFARRYLKGRRRNFYALFGGACFAWDRERVSDQQIDSCLEDVELIQRLHSDRTSNSPQLASWEKVMTKAELMVWRRKLDPYYLYEYKVFGTLTDCTAKSFLKVQVDLDYRKDWDKHVIDTSVVDQDKESGSEVVYWATHFPFPMQSRDYVYVRRMRIFHRHRAMVLVSKASSHPRIPESKRHIRVTKFFSKMVIKPFTSFDEKGFDYMLTYHDDPKAPFPTAAVSWLASTGVPEFVEKMHRAAVALDSVPGSNFKDMQSDEQYSTSNSSNYI